jgi:V/A-type H+-transporting ATPase subunit D
VPTGRGIPPGRAGRNWLRRRLATAERGREQLDRKLRILLPERERLHLQAQRCEQDWVDAVAEARHWYARMTALGGQDAVRRQQPSGAVTVAIGYRTSVGLSYPTQARIAAPSVPSTLAGNAASGPAAAAFGDALLAGARSAAADAAVRSLTAEIALTRRRLRALDKRWLPWLAAELAALEQSLEQGEQEDNVRLRQGTAARPGTGERP